MLQNTLKAARGAKKISRRIGRGNGSGRGCFSGRGVKGQKARTGGKIRRGFEGGQTPLIRKLPKLKGFKKFDKIPYQVVNLDQLNKIFEDGNEITPELLYQKKLISHKNQPVKILGEGKLEKKLIINANGFSKSAEEKIKTAGGEVKKIENGNKQQDTRNKSQTNSNIQIKNI